MIAVAGLAELWLLRWISYSYLAKRWGWSKSKVGRFMLKVGEYGIISRISFSSSHGSVISMCRYREMILGDDCEEIQLRRIGEILSLSRSLEMVWTNSKMRTFLSLALERIVNSDPAALIPEKEVWDSLGITEEDLDASSKQAARTVVL